MSDIKLNETKPAEARVGELTPLQKAALAIKELRGRLDAAESARMEPIALLGLACRFPGSAGLEAYWQLLSQGQDAIREVPPERWDLERFFDPNPNAPGKINSRYGGFIDSVDAFDAAFFGIAPNEAEMMDPQQRLLLELSWHALEDAGIPPASLRETRTGVFVGVTQMDYGVMQLGGPVEAIEAYTGTGNGVCFTAGRLAYFLGVHGPTFALDTACSSSMVALHQACQALRNRECDLAIVAGAQLNLTPPMQIFLSKTQSFAPDGRCRTFDASANGFVLGEGVGVVVLERLSDAQARQRPMRALIRSSGVNHDGPASGLTVPSEAAQEAIVRAVYERAKIAPDAVDYVETHGTATPLGDPIEVGALKSVFGRRQVSEPLLIGSVKTNFGHLNAAAGMAGLIKVVLMLEHELVAPNLHFQSPSPRIPWEGFNVRVPTKPLPWPRRADRARIAGVSSFGLSGTNTHTVVEEAPLPVVSAPGALTERPWHLLALSARSDDALRDLVRTYLDTDGLIDGHGLPDLCFSANTGRNHFTHRLALRCADSAQLRRQLEAYLDPSDVSSAGPVPVVGRVPRGGLGRLGLYFGDALPVDAILSLAEKLAPVAEALASAEAAWLAAGGQGALRASAAPAEARLLAAHLALASLWRAWGVSVAVVGGSGLGELAALVMAEALTSAEAFQVLAGQSVAVRVPQISLYTGADVQSWPFAPVPNYRFVRSPDRASDFITTLTQTVTAQGGVLACGVPVSGADANVLFPTTDVDLMAGLLDALARLYARGLAVDWAGFDAGHARQWFRLPLYPFQRQRFWLQPRASNLKAAAPACSLPSVQASTTTLTSATAHAAQPPQPEHATSALMPGSAALSPATPVSVPASMPQAGAVYPWSQLLGSQLDAAAQAINDIVAQQLAFLRSRAGLGSVAHAGSTPVGTVGAPASPTVATAPDAEAQAAPETAIAQESGQARAACAIPPAASVTTPATQASETGEPAVVEPAVVEPATQSAVRLGNWQLMRLAGDDSAALERVAGEQIAALVDGEAPTLAGTGRYRAMLVHQGPDDCRQALGASWPERDKRRVLVAEAQPNRSLVFLFPGVGDHYLRMAQGLYRQEPVFRARVNECCECLRALDGEDLRAVLYPAESENTAAAAEPAAKLDFRAMLGRGAAPASPEEERLNQTIHSQPLVFIIEYALGELWRARGIVPDAMIGYSMGEYAAACLAGVIELGDALRLIHRRSHLIQGLPHGVMLAVPLPEERVRPLLNESVSLCIVSTPSQCVVGGPDAAISALEARLKADEVVSRRLPGTHAFHSHMLSPLHQPLIELVGGFHLRPPQIPYLSNLTGDWITAADATDPAYWARHTWQTVRFAESLARLLDREGRVFLEVGPGQSLGSFVLQHPAAAKLKDKVVLPSLRNRYERQADEAFFLTTLGKLWLSGVEPHF